MKTLIRLYFWAFFAIFNSLNAFAQYETFEHDGHERSYLLHLPKNYSENSRLPLIIAMHGGFGNAYNMEEQSQLSKKADTENFIVVYPEGLELGLLKISSWNAGICCGAASREDIDDVGFINSLLNRLIIQYAIDTTRIYATGMSNGGFMSYRLGCELSHRIAAIAPVACSMTMADCSPSRSVPIIHFHSYADESIPYSGGIGNGVSDHYNPPLDSVLNFWATSNSCSNLNDTVFNNSQYTFIKWGNCKCKTEIQQYITHDGGHSWPGGRQTAIGDPVSEYISATDLMWDFLKQYSLGCESQNTISVMVNNSIQIFPNPTKNWVTIEFDNDFASNTNLILVNTSGKVVFTELLEKGSLCYDLNLTKFPVGVYLLQINSGELSYIRKIIKQ